MSKAHTSEASRVISDIIQINVSHKVKTRVHIANFIPTLNSEEPPGKGAPKDLGAFFVPAGCKPGVQARKLSIDGVPCQHIAKALMDKDLGQLQRMAYQSDDRKEIWR